MKIKNVLPFITLSILVGCKNNEPGIYQISPHFEHVVIFGVDGVGGAFKSVDTPNFDLIFANGSINYEGIAESPTISAQNWGSMVYGVGCERHQKTNAYIAAHKHEDTSLPSFLSTYAANHEQASFYSAVNWTPINFGLFEDLPQLTKDNISEQYSLPSAQIDDKVCEHVINRLSSHSDAITFMQFDSVDGAGHAYGNASTQYAEAIQHIDTLIGRIYDAYSARGLVKNTLFILVSDHGHTETGGHGGDSPSEKAVTFAANGGSNLINKGTCDSYHVYDLASIVLYALKEQAPPHYEGKVPGNLYNF